MAEADQRRKVVKALRSVHALAVENPMKPGTPDVNFADGWIELKWLRKWPVRKTTIVRIDHYTKEQRVFLKTRWLTSKSSFLILQVGREWLLFEGHTAAEHVGRVTKDQLKTIAIAYWKNGLNKGELLKCLT